jgi:hypothetical protein
VLILYPAESRPTADRIRPDLQRGRAVPGVGAVEGAFKQPVGGACLGREPALLSWLESVGWCTGYSVVWM